MISGGRQRICGFISGRAVCGFTADYCDKAPTILTALLLSSRLMKQPRHHAPIKFLQRLNYWGDARALGVIGCLAIYAESARAWYARKVRLSYWLALESCEIIFAHAFRDVGDYVLCGIRWVFVICCWLNDLLYDYSERGEVFYLLFILPRIGITTVDIQ